MARPPSVGHAGKGQHQSDAPGAPPQTSPAPRAYDRRAVVPRPALACAAAALSGFLSLVYEVSWTRLLALVLGPTTYAFAIMAASFITGIALGSSMATRLARRGSDPALWLGGTLILTAVSAPAAAWFAASRVPMFVATYVSAGAGFESIVLQQALAVALVLLPTSIALGAGFVLAVATATDASAEIGQEHGSSVRGKHRRRGGGRAVGRVSADSAPGIAAHLRGH